MMGWNEQRAFRDPLGSGEGHARGAKLAVFTWNEDSLGLSNLVVFVRVVVTSQGTSHFLVGQHLGVHAVLVEPLGIHAGAVVGIHGVPLEGYTSDGSTVDLHSAGIVLRQGSIGGASDTAPEPMLAEDEVDLINGNALGLRHEEHGPDSSDHTPACMTQMQRNERTS